MWHVQRARQTVGAGKTFDAGQDVEHFAHAPGREPQDFRRQRGSERKLAELGAGQGHVRRRCRAELHHLRDTAAYLLVAADVALDLLHADEHHRHLGAVAEVADLFQHGGAVGQGELGLVDDDGALAFNEHPQAALEQRLRGAARVQIEGLGQFDEEILRRPVHIGAQKDRPGLLRPAIDDVALAQARLPVASRVDGGMLATCQR